jgi:hypothetical protein
LSTNGEVQFPTRGSPAAGLTDGTVPTAVRICAYDKSNALSISARLTNGTSINETVQEGNCLDLFVASVDVSAACFWKPKPRPPQPCQSNSVVQYCYFGNQYTDVYYSYGWAETSVAPALDRTLALPVNFNFKGWSFPAPPRFYILHSEVVKTVKICTNAGAKIYYDVNDPLGSSQTFITSSGPGVCDTIAAKSVWFVGGHVGTYQVAY